MPYTTTLKADIAQAEGSYVVALVLHDTNEHDGTPEDEPWIVYTLTTWS